MTQLEPEQRPRNELTKFQRAFSELTELEDAIRPAKLKKNAKLQSLQEEILKNGISDEDKLAVAALLRASIEITDSTWEYFDYLNDLETELRAKDGQMVAWTNTVIKIVGRRDPIGPNQTEIHSYLNIATLPKDSYLSVDSLGEVSFAVESPFRIMECDNNFVDLDGKRIEYWPISAEPEVLADSSVAIVYDKTQQEIVIGTDKVNRLIENQSLQYQREIKYRMEA